MLATFGLATLALLALPGPTNALLAAAGAAEGPWRSLPLLAVATGGYGLSIGLLIAVLGPDGGSDPLLGAMLRLIAGGWLTWSAIRLWQRAASSPSGGIATPGRVFVTTALNPKALVFATAIFPSVASIGLLAPAAIFILAVAATGSAWIAIGSLAAETPSGGASPRLIARIAALALAGFAVWVIGWGIAGLTA